MSPNAERVHRFIQRYAATEGMMPLRKEIAAEFGWSSHGCVHRALIELEEEGLISRRYGRFVLPLKACPHCGKVIAHKNDRV